MEVGDGLDETRGDRLDETRGLDGLDGLDELAELVKYGWVTLCSCKLELYSDNFVGVGLFSLSLVDLFSFSLVLNCEINCTILKLLHFL